MNVLKLDNLDLAYGEQVLFDNLSLLVKKGQRLCLVGRNGVGKSTLLKVIEGRAQVDSGTFWSADSLSITSLSQELPEQSKETVFDYVAGGLGGLVEDLARYEALAVESDVDMDELARLQQHIENKDGWSIHNRIAQVLTRLELEANAKLSELSGGWRRRAALARALAIDPDVLLLDEPTNHLDIKAIEWLENVLTNFAGAVVFVTHDRTFLQHVATHIGELDRGGLKVWEGRYSDFLKYREQQLAEEEKHNAEFDKRLAREEVWIRQGIKARRTRNEGRVRALEHMRQQRSERRDVLKTANMSISGEGLSGKLVAHFEAVSFGWSNDEIVKDFTGTVLRGDKIGLIGPNGIGKTTFLKLMLGDLEPTSGVVKHGTKRSVAYFDQLRDQLDLEKSAMDNIAQGREFIEIEGKSRHVISYLGDFLFSGERARTAIKTLSGGERNRVLLAKLFSQPANLLILDEPTNDLDAETLDLLEELLINYTGTLLLVSHDRSFLDNVVTSTIGFEGQGRLKEYVGGYKDWQRQGGIWPVDTQQAPAPEPETSQAPSVTPSAPPMPAKTVKKKLSYKLQRELDELPAKIEALETQTEQLQKTTLAPGFYQQAEDEISQTLQQLTDLNDQLNACYHRWETLEQMKSL